VKNNFPPVIKASAREVRAFRDIMRAYAEYKNCACNTKLPETCAHLQGFWAECAEASPVWLKISKSVRKKP